MDYLTLAGGLTLLLLGGYALVRGASGLASSLGISQVVIGLTVVAFGTSAPELAVNLMAALRGSGDLSFGNIVGSNLANLGIILGISALMRPLVIESRIVTRELPMMLLATAVVVVLGISPDLELVPDKYTRGDGVILLLVFAVFLYTAVGDVVRQRRADPVIQQAGLTAAPPEAASRKGINALLSLLGLVGLYLGGELTVAGATAIARTAGLSDAIIGLTVVAVGTSLPELVTSVIATSRGQVDIAIGNVVGSNLFNLTFVLGTTSTIAPTGVPEGGVLDLGVLLFLSAIVLPFALSDRRTLVRWEGALLLAAWIGYTTFRVLGATGG